MSDQSRRPIGRINAKSKASGERLNLGTVWPGRFPGSHDLSLGCRTKDDAGNWVTYPVTVVVHSPKGDIKVTGGKEGNSFLNFYDEREKAEPPPAEAYGASASHYEPDGGGDFDDSIPFNAVDERGH